MGAAKITNLGMDPLILEPDPTPGGCKVIVHNTMSEQEPVTIQVEDIAVAFDRADVERIHRYLGLVLGVPR